MWSFIICILYDVKYFLYVHNIIFCYILLTLQVFNFFNKTKCRFSQYWCFRIVYNLISGNHILRCGKMHLKTCQHLCRLNSYTWTLDVSPRHFSSLTHLHGFIVWIILIFRINFWTTFFQFRIKLFPLSYMSYYHHLASILYHRSIVISFLIWNHWTKVISFQVCIHNLNMTKIISFTCPLLLIWCREKGSKWEIWFQSDYHSPLPPY